MASASDITQEKAHILDEDIYFAIFALLPTQADVSALMRSSRLLYGLGTRRLLQIGVHIATDSELVSFCQFMQRNLPGCAQYLTKLSIHIPWSRIDLEDDPDEMFDDEVITGAPLLVPVIPQLTHLVDLEIEFCEELLECGGAHLVNAFASLTTVRKLYVTSFGQGTHDVVKTMPSPILDLHVSAQDPLMDAFPYPFDMLVNRQSTLQKLFLGFCDLQESVIQQGLSTAVFPQVSALALMDCCILERAVLVRAFPNLRTLEVTGGQAEVADTGEQRVPGVEEARARNRGDWRCWPALDHVYGDVDSLYMLRLVCPVKRVDVLIELQEESVARMHAIIRNTRPPQLVIHCGYAKPRWPLDFNHAITPATLFGLLGRGPVYAGITHFGLDLGLAGISGDLAEYEVAIGHMLARVYARFFTLRVHAAECEYEEDANAPQARHLAVLSKFRGDYLATWAARCTPMLECVCVRLWDKDEFWHIVRQENGENAGAPLGVVQIDVDTGRALMLAEGMDWRPAAKTPILLPESSDSSSEPSCEDVS